jgi:hypothetical protein
LIFKKPQSKSYVYHVVYSFSNGFNSGQGSITMYRNRKINTVEDVKLLKEYIENETNVDGNVIIENWIRLKNAYIPELQE